MTDIEQIVYDNPVHRLKINSNSLKSMYILKYNTYLLLKVGFTIILKWSIYEKVVNLLKIKVKTILTKN